MTDQPARRTVDTITSDALDQLYARIAWLEQALATVADCFHESADDLEAALRLSRRSRRARASTVLQARRWAARARAAEQRAEQAEVAITRVRAIEKSPSRSAYNRYSNAIDEGWDDAIDAIRAALDENKEPRP